VKQNWPRRRKYGITRKSEQSVGKVMESRNQAIKKEIKEMSELQHKAGRCHHP